MKNFTIGNKRVCRCQALIIKDNKLMLLRNSGKKTEKEFWLLPGGAIHIGETSEQAIIRELKEEINISLSTPKLLDFTASNVDEYMIYTTYLYILESTVEPNPGVEGVESQSDCCKKILDIEWISIDEINKGKHSEKFRQTIPDIMCLLRKICPVAKNSNKT